MMLSPLRLSRAIEALRVVDGDGHVVPRRRLTPLATNLVRPVHDLGIGDVRAIKQLLRSRLRRRRQISSAISATIW